MNDPIKLILSVALILLTGCGESSDLKIPEQKVEDSGKPSISQVSLLSAVQTEFVAGSMPNQRPLNAPMIREYKTNADWRRRSLSGVSNPIPPSLDFIDDQGAWYTPFNQPGMPGYYDLRKLHASHRNAINASQYRYE